MPEIPEVAEFRRNALAILDKAGVTLPAVTRRAILEGWSLERFIFVYFANIDIDSIEGEDNGNEEN